MNDCIFCLVFSLSLKTFYSGQIHLIWRVNDGGLLWNDGGSNVAEWLHDRSITVEAKKNQDVLSMQQDWIMVEGWIWHGEDVLRDGNNLELGWLNYGTAVYRDGIGRELAEANASCKKGAAWGHDGVRA